MTPYQLPIFQVDAFSDKLFQGNPAAIVPLEHWLEDRVLQQIATENNLSETAYFVPLPNGYHLRWFTPVKEVKLCGHATLAAAHILAEEIEKGKIEFTFHTLSGPLKVAKAGTNYILDFPVAHYTSVAKNDAMGSHKPEEVFQGEDLVHVLASENDVVDYIPDLAKIKKLNHRGLIITAPGKKAAFVSRFFAPAYGIEEDPVTGSAHTLLTPYWAKRLGKSKLEAYQLSQRGGRILCELQNDRVMLSGAAVTYLTGTIILKNL